MEEEPEPNEKESVVEKILKYITGILTGLSLFYWTMKLFSLKIDSKKVLTSKVGKLIVFLVPKPNVFMLKYF